MMNTQYFFGRIAVVANSFEESATPVQEEASLVDLGFRIVIFIVLVGIGYLVWNAAKGIKRLEASEEEEAKAFEEQLVNMAIASPAALNTTPDPSLQAQMASSGESRRLPPPSVMARDRPLDPGSSDLIGDIGKRLQSLHLVEDREGRVALPVPPDGQIFRLKRGGSCLVIPRQESAEVMHFFCKRFDMVIFPGADGDLMILERFQSRLPSLMDDSPLGRH